MDISLMTFMNVQLKLTTSTFHRYMYSQVNWDARMFGLVGPRGVGKTTMILQYIKENGEGRKMLYVSADHVYLSTHSLIELADVSFMCLLSSSSMKACFTRAWQSSNTPSTSIAVMFWPRVVNWLSCILLTLPLG